MKLPHLACVVSLIVCACSTSKMPGPTPGALGFDGNDTSGWQAASTGGKGPAASWRTRADESAVSSPNVLSLVEVNHESEDRFNLFWDEKLRFGDGRLSVCVRADDGKIDQGGGPMWRVQDANNYYVCRFNPLESNFRVYVVQGGARRQLATALSDVEVGQWHRIEVEHVGPQITCWLDGRKLLETSDETISAPGGVGLWTKADARTSFDDVLVQPR